MATAGKQSWDRTPAARALAVLVVIAVGLVGFTSRQDDDSLASQSVQGFFETLNKPGARPNDFAKYLTGTSTTRIREATTNKPRGRYGVDSVGGIVNNTVRVTFTQDGEPFTATMAVRKVGRTWKLDDPFPTVRFQAEDRDLRFVVADPGTLLRPGRDYTLFPGRHTLAIPPSRSSPARGWELIEPQFVALPGPKSEVTVQGKVTADVEAEITQRISTAFAECLASDEFRPVGCPNRAVVPISAATTPQVQWSIDPSNAPGRPTFLVGSSVLAPCYVVSGTLSYSYLNREGVRVTRELDGDGVVGCTEPDSREIIWRD